MIRKIVLIWMQLMLLVLLAGCGNSIESKAAKCKELYSDLVKRHNEVIELYSDSMSHQYDERLDVMQKELADIGGKNADALTAEELDALIEDFNNRWKQYDEIFTIIETEEAEEDSSIAESTSVTIKNRTGLELYQLYFYNLSNEETKKNLLLQNLDTLGAFGTFNIVNIYMEDKETVWRLEVMDKDGNIIESEDVDLVDYIGKNVVINMEFSFDTMEGWIKIN